MMTDSNSWSVCISSDVELNFLVYVARAYGICNTYFHDHSTWPDRQVVLADELHREFETKWQDFWKGSIQQKAEAKIRQTAVSNFPSQAQVKFKHLNHNYVSPFVFNPPQFEAIEHQGLRDALIAQWPSFIQWWNMPAGGKAAMYYWEGKPDVIRYVREFEMETGRTIHPFHMNVELIYNGPHEPIEVADDYLIMPIRTEYLMKKDWWAERFREKY
ncbi:hypothetical protein AB4Z30_15265 [Paenibacillus sp. 2TAF8]|jgi:hypothetical protein|uniref:hypothetical protein n=1 Tax=Paenibacillus sp. 2TAF8 TaxID=3233020 RepID=UPI003F9E91BA